MSLALATGKNSHGFVSGQGPRKGGPTHPVLPKHNPPVIWQQGSLQESTAFGTVLGVRLTSCSPVPDDKPARQVRCRAGSLPAGSLPSIQGQSSSASPKLWVSSQKDSTGTEAGKAAWTNTAGTSTPAEHSDKGVKKCYERLCYKHCENTGGLLLKMQAGIIKPADIQALSCNNSYQAKIQVWQKAMLTFWIPKKSQATKKTTKTPCQQHRNFPWSPWALGGIF